MILTAARDTIERFQKDYICGKRHGPCSTTHGNIIQKLSEVTENYSQIVDQNEKLEMEEEQIERNVVIFQKMMLKHSGRVHEHVVEHRKIKEQVKKLNNEIDQLCNLAEIEEKMKRIQKMERRKHEMQREILSKEDIEQFMLLCSERHFNMMGYNEVNELIDKYNVRYKSHSCNKP